MSKSSERWIKKPIYWRIASLILIAFAPVACAAVQTSDDFNIYTSIDPQELKVDGSSKMADPSTSINITLVPLRDVRIGTDTVLVIDNSSSMGLADPAFTRKTVARKFIDQLDSRTDLIGVLPFNANTFDQCGLTNDSFSARSAIDAIPQPDKTGGTDIGKALLAGMHLLDSSPRAKDAQVSHSIVLLTDGCPEGVSCTTPETCLNISDSRIVREAQQKGYKIYIVHIGTSNLASESLQSLSQQTNGLYIPAIYDLAGPFNTISQLIPHPVLATNVTIIHILPPYLHLDPYSYKIEAPGISDAYARNNFSALVNDIDGTTTIKYHWGQVVASSTPLSLTYKVEFDNHLPVDELTDSNRTEQISKITYEDLNGTQKEVTLPRMVLSIKSNCWICLWGQ